MSDDEWNSEPTAMHRVSVALPSDADPDLLEQRRGPGAPRVLPLTEDEVVIGRSEGVAIRIPSSSVSRRHARIIRDGPVLSIGYGLVLGATVPKALRPMESLMEQFR